MSNRRFSIMVWILVLFSAIYIVFWQLILASEREADPQPLPAPQTTVTEGANASGSLDTLQITGIYTLSKGAVEITIVPKEGATSSARPNAPSTSPTAVEKALNILKLETVTEAINALTESVTGPVVAIGKLAGTVLLSLALLYLLAWFIDALRRPRQLVLADLVNASGDDSFERFLPGISQQNRAKLLEALKVLRETARENVEQQAPSVGEIASKMPFPRSAPKDVVEDLVKSIQDVGPKEYKLLAQFAQLFFPNRGTTVTCIVRSLSEAPNQLGLTIEIGDLQGQEEPTFMTFKETEPKGVCDCLPPCTPSRQHSSWDDTEAIPVGATEVYIKLASALANVGLFEDALSYLEEVFQLGKQTSEAASEIATECLKRLQTQRKAALAYSWAEQLEDAGLFQESANAYGHGMPVRMHHIVTQQWLVVFGLLRGDRALAYCKLARIYRKVFLCDEAKALYRLGAEHAPPVSGRAARILERMQQQSSDSLIVAGKCLCELGRYSDAEKYARMALDRVPDSPPAKRLFAEVIKQKSSVEGQVMVSSILDRYRSAAGPLMRWLALELLRRELTAGRPRALSEDASKRYDAETHNFLGSLHQTEGFTFRTRSSGQVFDKQSQIDFVSAIDLQPAWYLPYENMGGALLTCGCFCGDREKNQNYQEQAIEYLDLALEKCHPEVILGRISRFDELRIRATRAWALLLRIDADHPVIDQLQEARCEIQEMELVLERETITDCTAAEFWRVLAVMYALADRYGAGIPNSLEKARKYLVYTLARDGRRRYWERDYSWWVKNDPMLSCALDGLCELEDILELELIKYPDLPKLSGEEFESIVKQIMERAGWHKEVSI